MLEKIKTLDKQHFMNVFGNRTDICFTSGKGSKLYDINGKEYLDFFAGIAVNSVGYRHEKFVSELCEFLTDCIPHTSNLYYVEPQSYLAEKICKNSCADKVYFGNSGAEANECAIKLAKAYHYKSGNTHKTKFITLADSFHGRTLATVAATGQPKYQKPYAPLTPGFVHIPINDIEALEREFDETVAAVIAEPIQGESGIHPLNYEFAKRMRDLCTENDALLIFDEVQTGMGRCGTLFAYQTIGVEPDVFTLAKALGGGIPIGCCCAKDFAAKAFEPGDHGGTFGGNAFACKAGLTVFDIIENEHLVENSKETGKYFMNRLLELKDKFEIIKDIRGFGLMIGIETPVFKEAISALLERGIVAGPAGGGVIRLLPPLIITKSEVDIFIREFEKVMEELSK